MKHMWILVLLVCVGCSGPVGPISGGSLGGRVVVDVDDWSFAAKAQQIQLETVAEDGSAHSVNVWSGVIDGRLFIPTSLVRGADNPAEREWVRNAQKHSTVRVRIDGNVYPGTIRRVSDDELVVLAKQRILDKYDDLPDERSAQAWIFEVRTVGDEAKQ